MKVIVVGSQGLVGQHLQPRLEAAGFEAVGLDVAAPPPFHLDITQAEEVGSLIPSLAPDLIINCAAYTAVDRAESELELALAVNREGARHLAQVSESLGIPLMHLSTDYVFDGEADQPYGEDAPTHPLNVYGWSKWEGEEAIRAILPFHLILRTAWLYGVHGDNFLKTILAQAREREELRVVADQWGCPTDTEDLVGALAVMVRSVAENPAAINWGTYHFCGRGHTTWHGLAQAIVEEGRRCGPLRVRRVVPISTAEYPGVAQRPRWTVLDCQKIGAVFHLVPQPWRQGLADTVKSLLSESGLYRSRKG